MEKVVVKNILKDGSVVEDLTGHVVRKEDNPTVYTIIEEEKNDA